MMWYVQSLSCQHYCNPVLGIVLCTWAKVYQQLQMNGLIFDAVDNEGQKNNIVTTEYLATAHHHGTAWQTLFY